MKQKLLCLIMLLATLYANAQTSSILSESTITIDGLYYHIYQEQISNGYARDTKYRAEVVGIVDPYAKRDYHIVGKIYVPSYNEIYYKVDNIRDSVFYNSNAERIFVDVCAICTIGKLAFGNCTKLRSVLFLDRVDFTSTENPFKGCHNLENIYYFSDVQSGIVATTNTYVHPDITNYYVDPDIPNYKILYTMNDFGSTDQFIKPLIYFKNIHTGTYFYDLQRIECEYSGESPTSAFEMVHIFYSNEGYSYKTSWNVTRPPYNAGSTFNYSPWTKTTKYTNTQQTYNDNMLWHFSITIIPKDLWVAPPLSVTKTYGEDNPEFKIRYSGFVDGEDESVLIEQPIITTTATKLSDVGIYDLHIEGGKAQNYTFSYGTGSLTIIKAKQELTWEQYLDSIKPHSQVRLSAVSNSGLPITYTLDNDSVASLEQIGDYTYLNCFNNGKVTISAQQVGNKNYEPSKKMDKIVHIGTTNGIRDISIIEAGNSRINIIETEGRITIKGLNDKETALIYTSSGALVYTGNNGSVNVSPGRYIIRIGNIVKKVIVK